MHWFRFVLATMLIMLVVYLFIPGHLAQAQDQPTPPPPTPTINPEDPGELLPFSLFGFPERKLVGPADRTDYYFSLPEEWVMTTDGTLNLDLQVLFSGYGFQVEPGQVIGNLTISLNYITLLGIPVRWQANDMPYPITVPLPYSILQAGVENNGRQTLSIELDAGINCLHDTETAVIIRPTSSFIIPHVLGTPRIDLARLPRPIYQQTFRIDRATLVMPDQPTADELRAALITAAGFGRMTRGRLVLSFVQARDLTPELLSRTHLILVGKPVGFPFLAELALPTPVSNGVFQSTTIVTDDGVLQLMLSPWNSARVVLMVSGNHDAGVVKAAQALSTGSLRQAISVRPDLFVVADVRQEVVAKHVVSDNRTFAELGYQTETRYDRGENTIEYPFTVPPGYTASMDSYLDLVFNHSAMLNLEQSGMSVLLNDEYIGSVKFSEESTRMTTKRMSIPPSELRIGENILQVLIMMRPIDECMDPSLRGTWAKVWSESLLHLPLTKAKEEQLRPPDLSRYPELLLSSPTLQTTAFILPSDQPAAWKAAATLMFFLGVDLRGDIAEPLVAFAHDVPQTVRQQHLVIVGQSTGLPIIQEINPFLPIPFTVGSNLAETRGATIIYRFPPDLPVGYLQLATDPAAPQQVILTVMGNSETGMWSSTSALTNTKLRRELSGNFAFIQGEKIAYGDTRFAMRPEEVAATAVPTGTIQKQPLAIIPGEPPTTSITASIQAQAAQKTWAERNRWIVPMFGVSTALMVLLVLGVSVSSLWRRFSIYRAEKQDREPEERK